MSKEKDFAESGLDIQSAMLRHAKAFPNPSTRPKTILWGSHEIRTSLKLSVPCAGTMSLRFLSPPDPIPQAIDIKIPSGGVKLRGGEVVPLLRTWQDERYEDSVEYEYEAPERCLFVWNAYRVDWPSGTVTEEKWTGNAGFWVDQKSDKTLVFHCSPGPIGRPDFERLVFELRILDR